MAYKVDGSVITVDDTHFNAEQILQSGQLFLHRQYADGHLLVAGEHACYIYPSGATWHIECTDTQFFINFFDLQTHYAPIYDALWQTGGVMAHAAEYGKGIRILNQPEFATIISFIVSANNNIKRISGILFKICAALGERKVFRDTFYHTFPEPAAMAAASPELFYQLGSGYRAPYIWQTSHDIALGRFDIALPRQQGYADALKTLTRLYGVGKKVADCVLLFAYGRQDVFPVDTWIEKVYRQHFAENPQKSITREGVSGYFVDKFAKLSGYAQQYLFYYQREYGKIELI